MGGCRGLVSLFRFIRLLPTSFAAGLRLFLSTIASRFPCTPVLSPDVAVWMGRAQRAWRALEAAAGMSRNPLNGSGAAEEALGWLSVCDGHCTLPRRARAVCGALGQPRACPLGGACAVFENTATHLLSAEHHRECVLVLFRRQLCAACAHPFSPIH